MDLPALQTDSGPLRLLLVEDDADDVLLCCDAIARSDLRCARSVASSLHEALEHLHRDGADVVLVDLSLPDAHELEAVTTLARHFAELPIVVLTGLSDEQAALAALQAGAEDYLVKGRSSHETISRAVRYAIERKRGEQSRRAREAAEAENQAKNVFISRMSHELRTPLNAILGFAQLLESGCTGPEREFAGHILTAGRRLYGLVNEVLDLARAQIGQAGLTLQPVHLAGVVDEAVALIRPSAADHEVTVTTDLGGTEDLHILADQQRLGQVLLNLLSNAVKYNKHGGTVTVACAPGDGRLRLTVRDTGIGLSREQLAKLFTPFNRLGAEGSAIEGSGLGLVITKHLVEAMGGAIGVDSVPGAGTTVWTQWRTASADAAAQLAPDPARPAAQLPPGLILYIEDDPANRILAEQILHHHPQIRLVMATTGAAGLDLARHHRPDVILLDLNLPDTTGYDVMTALRSGPEPCTAPVVVITADATPDTRDHIARSGAFAHLTKPFQIADLLDTTAAALHHAARHHELPTAPEPV